MSMFMLMEYLKRKEGMTSIFSNGSVWGLRSCSFWNFSGDFWLAFTYPTVCGYAPSQADVLNAVVGQILFYFSICPPKISVKFLMFICELFWRTRELEVLSSGIARHWLNMYLRSLAMNLKWCQSALLLLNNYNVF